MTISRTVPSQSIVRVPTCYAVRRWGPGLPAVDDSVDHAKELAEYTNARAADVENMWVLNSHICGLGVAQSIMPVFGAFAGGTWVDESKGQAPEGYIWELPHMPTHVDMSHAVATAQCPSTPELLQDPRPYCILSYSMARPEAMLRAKNTAWRDAADFSQWRAFKSGLQNFKAHTQTNTSSAMLSPDNGYAPLEKHPDSIALMAARAHEFLSRTKRTSQEATKI